MRGWGATELYFTEKKNMSAVLGKGKRTDAPRDERVKEVATDAAEDSKVETQTDKVGRRGLSVGDADPDN